ncbi:hypothetical protein DOZ80_02795 [Pseudomonas fluorescens]|uniref:L-carnitine dehydrogenase n=1 Tax=Pseudomonas fluorescens TaxID=294 RepID=A0A327NC30_PSEFL|nr:3-hydroxyacyl-CoA dehydrogenase NAD-binding domain-containing protein [Pseudomonas fluorescens]RAI72485.1 hypothetical protein DOZ80_02795 [Pseudomonas fluorescens]
MSAQSVTKRFQTVVCIGAGNIGAGWAAHYMRAGLDVVVYDPVAARSEWLDEYFKRAMPALEALGLAPGAGLNRVRFTTNIEDALAGAQFVQESTPEVLEDKIKLFKLMTDIAPADAIIASSSAGFLAKDLRSCAKGPERILIGHPFNPPFLVPIVEIAGGDAAPESAAVAAEFYKSTGCEVVELKREINGYIGNRIQAAVLREIFYMYSEGIADVATIDRAISSGPALRWAVMGPSSTFFLGTQNPDMYADFVNGLVEEIHGGFVADPAFSIDPQLIKDYAAEVRTTIGVDGQKPLLDLRNTGVVKIRQALDLMRENGAKFL